MVPYIILLPLDDDITYVPDGKKEEFRKENKEEKMGVYLAFFNASIIFCSYKFFGLFITAISAAL